MQTTNSWTRENALANDYLANGGTKLNNTSGLYDLDFRNYDPVLGRLTQVDPLADKFGSYSPYHYSYNNPVSFTDPSGLQGGIAYGKADPADRNGSIEWIAGDQAGNIGGAVAGERPVQMDEEGIFLIRMEMVCRMEKRR